MQDSFNPKHFRYRMLNLYVDVNMKIHAYKYIYIEMV